ncbi:Ribosomal RNA adenine methyltransferase KsgA/Erm [Dillenia turbinata]|uniref:rRNA adenine N(6)-methyltransferase n=1 Tax=Dillenia turbinata TaxID=194707 RepID=A0AAN8Z6T7_9MAGN
MLSRLSSNNFARFTNPQNYSPSLYSKLYRRHRNNNSVGVEDEDENRMKKNDEKREGHVPIQLHKSRGQHILTNPRVLDTIVRKSEIKPTDTVLETGTGTGNLNLRLLVLEVAKKVVAVEIDGRVVEILNNRVAERGYEEKLRNPRILKLDLEKQSGNSLLGLPDFTCLKHSLKNCSDRPHSPKKITEKLGKLQR